MYARGGTPKQITLIVYLHVILFRVHERGTAPENKFDILMHIKLNHTLAQRFKQKAK